MERKIIAVLEGGYTDEAEISYGTAAFVMDNIDREIFDPVLCTIIENKWVAHVNDKEIPIDRKTFTFKRSGIEIKPDAIFMAIHGTPGEDGVLQEYFEEIGIPCNTGDAKNMAITFNKVDTTNALRDAGFKVADSVLLTNNNAIELEQILKKTGLPCFVKPNNGGSSLGISRVNVAHELPSAIERAFAEDEQVMIESFLEGTEVTCGVLKMNGKIQALPVTEVISKNEFFDYESKYTDGGNKEITPARLSKDVYEKCQRISEDIYVAMDCRGIVRIDYMIHNEECSIIEVNTVPGMSAASIIPKQAAAAGIAAKDMLTATLNDVLN